MKAWLLAVVGLASLLGCIGGGVESVVSSSVFEQMLKHRNDDACPAKGFYTYSDFVAASDSFPGFATTGGIETRKREVAAFLAQTSHETTARGDGQQHQMAHILGVTAFFKSRGIQGPAVNQMLSGHVPPGKSYFGRGPIQISYNYNYGPAGHAFGSDLLNDPDLVATDPTLSFKTALWFWMTPQSPKPSCHDVATGKWKPTPTDRAAGRVPGFGVITNIVNGGVECGKGANAEVANRIGFYKRYCDMLGVSYGANLDCYNQVPF